MILCKFGNEKAGDDTLVFNMGSATRCPSRDLCPVLQEGRGCYPSGVEARHPEIAVFRDRQGAYWQRSAQEQIVADILDRTVRRQAATRYLRFNEAGDFWSQECVEKLSYVAEQLFQAAGIVTYGFTARRDLDFGRAAFLVKGSGHQRGNNGSCTVISQHDTVPGGYVLCPEDCTRCNLCMSRTWANIAFIER